MSKRQRESLRAEVERHRQQQQQHLQAEAQPAMPYPSKACCFRTPHLLQAPAPAYSFPGEPELPPCPTDVLPYLVCSPGESQAPGLAYQGSCVSPGSGHSDERGKGVDTYTHSKHIIRLTLFNIYYPFPLLTPFSSGFDSRQPSPDQTIGMGIRSYDPEDPYCPYRPSLLHIEELCDSIVRSHRDTSQFRLEELQALRWKLFSREEIHAYQSKVLYQHITGLL